MKYLLGTESITSSISECANPLWIGDGFCDDLTNNLICNYDGGDCCGPAVNIVYCNLCECKEENHNITTIPPTPTTTGKNNQTFTLAQL